MVDSLLSRLSRKRKKLKKVSELDGSNFRSSTRRTNSSNVCSLGSTSLSPFAAQRNPKLAAPIRSDRLIKSYSR
ncbi:hypothetical protein M3Y99_01085700 [Aphelenchoides fujianensis]|nr:hypothetical protein M3Y99_01085700 [Aphelenchoides fujianensis]